MPEANRIAAEKGCLVTVIIPMYNSDKYLADCLTSLGRQGLPQEQVEIICVNDGSSDNTAAICEKFASSNPQVKLLNIPHKGVSRARNVGIANARGKYLTFIDSDDMLADDTLSKLAAFMNEYSADIDIATFDSVYLVNGLPQNNRRNALYKNDCIVSLQIDKYFAQTRINVIIKNDKSILFREDMAQYEDQQYLLDFMLRKGKIGYCKGAAYIYRQHSAQTVAKLAHPYFFFDTLMNIFAGWLGHYNNTPYLAYVQGLILHDFWWRLQSDKLLPYHHKGQDYELALARWRSVLNRIGNRVIWHHPLMSTPHKEFFLSQKTEGKACAIINEGCWYLCDADGALESGKAIGCIIQRARLENGKFRILAFLKSPVLNFVRQPCVYAVINDREVRKLDTFPSCWRYFDTKAETSRYWGFHAEIDLEKTEKFFFYVSIEGVNFTCAYWFTDMNQLSTARSRFTHLGRDLAIFFRRNAFFKVANKAPEALAARSELHAFLKNTGYGHDILWHLARQAFSAQTIWLYNDAENIFDNAYLQFKHDFPIQDGITRFYITKSDPQKYADKFTAEEMAFVVKFGSKRHRMLFLMCVKILTSFSQTYFFIPYKLEQLKFYYHRLRFEVIYLQHGVMHAKVPFLYSKERNFIDKIVISTTQEEERLLNELSYQKQDLIPTGMSRFDQLGLIKDNLGKNRILYVPSWRRYLVDQNIDKWSRHDDFMESEYYAGIQNLLADADMAQFLEQQNLYLDIKLHPIMKIYEDCFRNCQPRVKMVDGMAIGDYKILITDFSSFLYDFLYIGRPVIFYVPDRAKFDAGLHSYRELYINLEMSFGEYAENIPDLLRALANLTNNAFKQQAVYAENIKDMFIRVDGSHADALYSYLHAPHKGCRGSEQISAGNWPCSLI